MPLHPPKTFYENLRPISWVCRKPCFHGRMGTSACFSAADSAPPQAAAAAPTESAVPDVNPPFRKCGRPTQLTQVLVDSICALIRRHGYSDTRAGLRAGVPSTTLAYWKD